uniref:Uncharacterized protein n=1 Tax=Romanomermis culicivorax TaxID=13658 RepID=A0A915JBV7_ROMCU
MENERNRIVIETYFQKAPIYVLTRMEGRLHEFKNIASLAEFVNKLKADTTAWKEFSEDQEDGDDDRLNPVYENRRFNNLQIPHQDNIGHAMDNDNPDVVIIVDPPIATTPAIGNEGIIQEERVMEVVEAKTGKQPEVQKLTEQIKEMQEKIQMLEKEKYRKAAIELAKQLETLNDKEEGTSKEPFVEVVSKIVSEEDENPQANILPAPPVYAKAGGQNVENITNPEKFAKVIQFKRQMKEKRIAEEENKAEWEKVKTENFQQLAGNLNDRIKYGRGLEKRD